MTHSIIGNEIRKYQHCPYRLGSYHTRLFYMGVFVGFQSFPVNNNHEEVKAYRTQWAKDWIREKVKASDSIEQDIIQLKERQLELVE